MSDPVTRLVLVRHGQSKAAVEGIIGGHRGCTGLSPLGRRQVEALVVACHGGIVDASFRALGGLAIQHRLNEEIDNAGVTSWVHAPATGWRLERYNDAAHLNGVDA